MNEAEVREAINKYHWVRERVRVVAIKVADIRNVTFKVASAECYVGFEFDLDEVTANFEESTCSCCSPEYYEVKFPVSYLWTENFAEIEAKAEADRQEEAERQRKERQAKEEAERKRLREQSDWQTYQRLKKKYESGDPA